MASETTRERRTDYETAVIQSDGMEIRVSVELREKDIFTRQFERSGNWFSCVSDLRTGHVLGGSTAGSGNLFDSPLQIAAELLRERKRRNGPPPWEPTIPASDGQWVCDLDPAKIRDLAIKTRWVASNAKTELNSESSMIHWDDEADGLYLLACAIEDHDMRGRERAWAGLDEDSQEAVLNKCQITPPVVQEPQPHHQGHPDYYKDQTS